MKKLHLVLKHEWYDKIASGEKTSEYREPTEYWSKRLAPYIEYCMFRRPGDPRPIVVFHRGYTNKTMEFNILSVFRTTKQNDLNIREAWEIRLDGRVE